MKRIYNVTKVALLTFGLVIVTMCLGITSCTEDINQSNLYTFTGQTMSSYLAGDTVPFKMYTALLKRVHPSKKSNSTMFDLLSARGNYTCFAPNDLAMQKYLAHHKYTLEDLPDSLAKDIVFNSIIDNGNERAYASTSFVEGALSRTNMNDRYIQITFSVDSVHNMQTITHVNTDSKIVENGSVEVVNGYIHQIDSVLSPSTSSVADVIYETPNLTIFSQFLKAVGLDDQLALYKDIDYEESDTAGLIGDLNTRGGFEGTYPEHRYFGYTIFTETDDVFKSKGITDIESLRQYLSSLADYSEDTDWDIYPEGDSHYNNKNNWLYKFVTYHIIPIKLTWNRLVMFSNEKGFNNNSPNDGTKFQTNVWEYYETLNPERNSIKITGIKSGKVLNRMSVYDTRTYKELPETSTDPDAINAAKLNSMDNLNIELSSSNGSNDNQALNGFYYPINKILVWTDKIPNEILNERQRYDICSLLPELMTNNHRRTGDATHCAWYYPANYFEKTGGGSGALINVSKETKLIYLTNTQNSGGGGAWINYQADEFNIQGIYDFVMKLPPVPTSGTYEIRYGMNSNTLRGMAQIYIGTNPNNLPAVGIPIDLRVNGTDAAVGWIKDESLDGEEAIEDLDKQLRNKDYMKGPKYFYDSASECGRDCSNCLRRIIFRGQLDAGKTYYIRFKSVLESSTSEFFYDYLEIVPKKIFNGENGYSGNEPEDKW